MNYRVCLEKSTGRLLEMQSGGDDSHLETLRQNARNAGFTDDQVEVKFVDEAGWKSIQGVMAAAAPREVRRRIRYAEVGCTIEALMVAWIEKYAENRPEVWDDLMLKRAQVKEQIDT